MAALLSAGCGVSGGPSAPAPAPTVLLDSHVPWSQVGPGWTLATWADSAESATVVLTGPTGQRHPIARIAEQSRLTDWSGDGRRALFSHNDYDFDTTTLTEINLDTGTTTTLTLEGRQSARYTRPTGKALLVIDEDLRTLRRVDLGGVEQLVYPTDRLGAAGPYNGHHLPGIDGTFLVLGAGNGLAVVGNNGRLRDHLALPGPHTNCAPVRWWSSGTVLARCSDADSLGTQLWQVPLGGGAPTAMTAFSSGRRDDYGDVAAWRLAGGSYVQSLGDCGAAQLNRLTADGEVERLQIPGVDAGRSVVVVGATAGKLLLRTTESCGPGIALLTYDPAVDRVQVLLGPPVTDGGVTAALAYGGNR